jgi:hypothetical protein
MRYRAAIITLRLNVVITAKAASFASTKCFGEALRQAQIRLFSEYHDRIRRAVLDRNVSVSDLRRGFLHLARLAALIPDSSPMVLDTLWV